jgi:hypothetical protein
MVLVSLNDILNSFTGSFKSDRELGQRSKSPANNHVTSLTFAVMLIEDVFVAIKNLFFWDGYRLTISVAGRSINQHFTELTHKPAA